MMEFSMRISASDYWRMFTLGDLSEQPDRVRAFAQAYAELNEKFGRLLSMQPGPPISIEPGSNLGEIIERARVVKVLDTWAEKASGGCGWRMSDLSPIATPTCTIYPTSLVKDARHFTAATPDAARAAAAKAIENGEVP